MIKFPSIEQYRNAIRNVQHAAYFTGVDDAGEPMYDRTRSMPVLKYRGTVKLHGTNAGIVLRPGDPTITFQSRERELTVESDNAGFMNNMLTKLDFLYSIFNSVTPRDYEVKNHIALFGEWCGQGVQKGVAISNCPKMFVIFGVQVDNKWLDPELWRHIEAPEAGIYNIHQFETYEVEIDFARPEYAQQKMVEITEAVEAKCPVGAHFGHEGVGEGVVWQPADADWADPRYWFKVKGEKHSVSKVKTLAAVDVEAVAAIHTFVDSVVTEQRLEQGLDNLVREQLKPFNMQSLGDFIRWVYNDIMKEEADTIQVNNLDPKKLGGPISNAARKWYIDQYNLRGL